MLDHSTLIGIACLIANKGPVNTDAIEAQLNSAEQAQVQQIIVAGSCLPSNVERLIQSTREDIENGVSVDGSDSGGSPSRSCG